MSQLPLSLGLLVPCTESEGPGRRMAIWTRGCSLLCPGCCNPELLKHSPRDLRDPEQLADELEAAHAHYDLEGVSFLGGEPTEQALALVPIAQRARSLGLSVMLFSGHTLAALRAKPEVSTLLALVDVLVDGRYEEARRSTARRFIGSDNQVLHLLTDRYKADDPRWAEPNTLEVRLRTVDGEVVLEINGFPVR